MGAVVCAVAVSVLPFLVWVATVVVVIALQVGRTQIAARRARANSSTDDQDGTTPAETRPAAVSDG